jgi:hypothetical protein
MVQWRAREALISTGMSTQAETATSVGNGRDEMVGETRT